MFLWRRGWCNFLRRRDKYRSFGAEGTALLYNGLRYGCYVIVEEEVVGACGLRKWVYRGVAVSNIYSLKGISFRY